MRIRDKLAELGSVLPLVSPPIGSYADTVTVGDLIYVSGKGPKRADGTFSKGRLGAEVSITQGYQDALQAGLSVLATLESVLGDLDRVRQIVKLTGFVNAVPEFQQHPAIINGCSDLFVDVFGDRGKHARSAVGVSSLPFGMTVEIEVIVQFWNGA